MATPQVLVVGAGVTGSLLTFLLHDDPMTVRVVEKAKGVGGRFCTTRFRGAQSVSRDDPVLACADLGAQYVTSRASPKHPQLGPIYDMLLQGGVLRPFDGKVEGKNPHSGGEEVRHFTAPHGMVAIPEFFLDLSCVVPEMGCAVSNISVEGEHLRVHFERGSARGSSLQDTLELEDRPFIVVLTQPVRQVLGEGKFGLKGNLLEHVDASLKEQMMAVQYSSRFAAAYFFDSANFKWPYDFTVKYFDGGDVRYVAHDSARRNQVTGEDEEELVDAIVVHSAWQLGSELDDESEPFPKASKRLQDDLEAKMSEIPWASASTKVHKWKFGQVLKGFNGHTPTPTWSWSSSSETHEPTPGVVTLLTKGHSMVLLAGDAMAPAGSFEGCVYSAFQAAALVREFLASIEPFSP